VWRKRRIAAATPDSIDISAGHDAHVGGSLLDIRD
jgi:hypothetical protein